MIDFLSNMSLVPKGLKYKTMIAFSLMSLIPLLICVWLVTTYIFPNISLFLGLSLGNISLILVISVIISLLGLYMAKQMIDPVIKMAGYAKDIAEGNVDKVIKVDREDEIGALSMSLNIMTHKIKENMEELKNYGEKTKLINMEINKKVLALSGLLQVGNLISSSNDILRVLNFISQKISELENDSCSFIVLPDSASGELKIFSYSNIEKSELDKLAFKKDDLVTDMLIIDKSSKSRDTIASKIIALLDLKNIAIFPIFIARKPYGMVVLGNTKESFLFKEDERELLRIFVKQVAIVVENDILTKKAKELAIKDELTDLYNEGFIHTRLDEEIKRARLYQRPCGYLLIDIDNFKDFHERFGVSRAETLLKCLGGMLDSSVTAVDKVGHFSADRFAIIVPEKNKKQVAGIAEEIRKKVESDLAKIMEFSGKLTVSIGVSENPIDGSNADELMKKAENLVKNAKSLGKNRVVV
ncbi:diguanylate cyclase [Candidatus Omnitrophota bacterium]